MQKNKASTSGKRKVNDNSSDQHSTKKTKVNNVLKNNGEDENTEREEEGIVHDFDYHDTINADSHEKYFENICKLLTLTLSAPPLRFFAHNSEREEDNSTKFGDFS